MQRACAFFFIYVEVAFGNAGRRREPVSLSHAAITVKRIATVGAQFAYRRTEIRVPKAQLRPSLLSDEGYRN